MVLRLCVPARSVGLCVPARSVAGTPNFLPLECNGDHDEFCDCGHFHLIDDILRVLRIGCPEIGEVTRVYSTTPLMAVIASVSRLLLHVDRLALGSLSTITAQATCKWTLER